MSQQNLGARGGHFDCRDHSWCCDSKAPEPIDDVELRLPLRLNKLCEREHGLFASVGVHEGNRPYMEDRHRAIYARDGHRGYFAVHDGHGGSEAAQYLAEHMYEDLISAIDKKLRQNKKFKPVPALEMRKGRALPSKSPSPTANGEHGAQANGAPAQHKAPSSTASPEASISQHSPPVGGAEAPLAAPGDSIAAPISQVDVAVDMSAKSHDTLFEDEESAETATLIKQALKEGSISCENHLLDCAREFGFTSGSTSVSVLVRGNRLYSVNVGDSRAVLCRNGEAINLSDDHKPGVPAERERIEKHEGEVGQMLKNMPLCCALFGEREKSVGAFRVWPGGLSVSRTFGDVNYKDPSLGKTHSPHILIADPDIKEVELTPEDEFMILATDGFWDVVSSQDAVKFLRKKRRKKKFVPSRAGSMLCDRAYNYGSGDNITCIVVFFTHHRPSWQRTPHRSPEQLTRVPYRVEVAQCHPSSPQQGFLNSSDALSQEAKTIHPDGREVTLELVKLQSHAPADETNASSPCITSSLSIPCVPAPPSPLDPQRCRSDSNSRRDSECASKSARRSYSRSRSKNDSRHGYSRDSKTLTGSESHAKDTSEVFDAERSAADPSTKAHIGEPPAAAADVVAAGSAVIAAEDAAGCAADDAETTLAIGVDDSTADGALPNAQIPLCNGVVNPHGAPSNTSSPKIPSTGHDRTRSSQSAIEPTNPETKQDVRRLNTDPIISSNSVVPIDPSHSEEARIVTKPLVASSSPVEHAASEDVSSA